MDLNKICNKTDTSELYNLKIHVKLVLEKGGEFHRQVMFSRCWGPASFQTGLSCEFLILMLNPFCFMDVKHGGLP